METLPPCRHRSRAFVIASTVLLATPAFAVTSTVAFVSALSGKDSNNATGCLETAPCRTIQTALGVSTDEVFVLDSGEYDNAQGAISLTSPLSIISPPGVTAELVCANSPCLTINMPFSNMPVTIRGVALHGVGSTTNQGIQITSGVVHLERVTVFGFSGGAIAVTPTSSNVNAFLLDVTARDNTATVLSQPSGLFVKACTTCVATVEVDSSHFDNNAYGIVVDNGTVVIRNSRISNSPQVGVASRGCITSTNGPSSDVTVENSELSNNGNGAGAFISTPGSCLPFLTISNSRILNSGSDAVVVQGSCFANLVSNVIHQAVGHGVNAQPGSHASSDGRNMITSTSSSVAGTLTVVSEF